MCTVVCFKSSLKGFKGPYFFQPVIKYNTESVSLC